MEPLLHDAQPRMDRPAKRLRSVVIPPVHSEKLAGEEVENDKPPVMSGRAPAAENAKQPPTSERAPAAGKARSAWREEWERRRAAELAAADGAGMPTAATGGGPLARANSNCSDPRFAPHIAHFHTRSALWRPPVVRQICYRFRQVLALHLSWISDLSCEGQGLEEQVLCSGTGRHGYAVPAPLRGELLGAGSARGRSAWSAFPLQAGNSSRAGARVRSRCRSALRPARRATRPGAQSQGQVQG